MKIAQVIPCLGENSGGPSRSVYSLAQGLREAGVEIEILTQNYIANPNIVTEDWIEALTVRKVRPFEYNPYYGIMLKNKIAQNKYQLLHINSIYSYPTFIAASMAKKVGLPYIIAPRGSLYQDTIEASSKWKKMLYNALFLKQQLNCASAVHTTCIEEMEVIRQMGITSPIAIIPNSIKLPQEKPSISNPSKLRVCYLGRINSKKNIKGLVEAWHYSGLSHNQNAELIIIGAAQLEKEKNYLEDILRMQSELSIGNIIWTGPKMGAEKEALLSSCSYLIMPSFSENFGMVVPEALQYGVPVIASKGTPWQVLEDINCGWWTDIDVDSLANSLKHLLTINEEERRQMGRRGQQLVWERFSTVSVCKMQIRLYEWIINGGDKPSFVYI